MLEQSLLPERIFGLAAVDGRRSVRPGEVIRFRFRARNTSEVVTPSALLVFVLPGGWTPLDPLEAEIPPVAPGSEHVVAFRARPDVADASTSDSPIQAALRLDTLVLGSNVVRIHVFGHPRLNGPASGIRIETGPQDALRVVVEVVNEGDAAARGVRVAVPPPPGFVAVQAETTVACAELAVGASLSFAYEMTPLAPPAATVRIDDAFVTYDGGRVSLITGAACLLGPELMPPAVDAQRSATRLDLNIRIANAGWVAARDVRCALELPAGWRVLRGTMLADEAPATIHSDKEIENGVAVTLPLVPARGFVDVSVVASARRPRAGAALLVRCGGHAVERPIPDPATRSVRVEARPESAYAEPGTTIPVAVDVNNNGETLERVAVAIDGTNCWIGEIRPGTAAAFVVRVPIAPALGDGQPLSFVLIATGDDGTELAQTTFEIRSLDRPWIAVDDVTWDGVHARVTIRNVGATTARDVRVAGEADPLVAALSPGEAHTVSVDPAVARHASIAGHDGREVPIAWDDQEAPVVVRATLKVPGTVRTGERLDVRLRCVGEAAVSTLRVRPQPRGGAGYVAGSTTINGHAIVDGVDGPPLFAADGLVLHEIPAGTPVDVAWSLLPRTPGELDVAVDVDANGSRLEPTQSMVRVADAPPFGARPAELPFHIDAATVGDFSAPPAFAAAAPAAQPGPVEVDDLPAAPQPSEPAAWALGSLPDPLEETAALPVLSIAALVLTLDTAHSAALLRVLRGSRGPGIAGHLPAFAVLFPTVVTAGDEGLQRLLAAAGEAVRGVYERLFVKLRIPGYDVTPHDLEDAATRRDVLNLLDALALATGGGPPSGLGADLTVTLDRARITAARNALAAAPLGSARAPAAIAELLPRTGTSAAAIALGAYVSLLAGELDRIFDRPDAACPLSAVTQRTLALDAARAVAIAALDPRSELAAR